MYTSVKPSLVNEMISELKLSASINNYNLQKDIVSAIKRYFLGSDAPEVILIDLRNSESKGDAENINTEVHLTDVSYLSAYAETIKPSQQDCSKGDSNTPRLTRRETEVLELIVKGLSYNEISTVLGMSLHTVNSHIKNTYRKLSVSSRGEAVFEAMQLGLVSISRQ